MGDFVGDSVGWDEMVGLAEGLPVGLEVGAEVTVGSVVMVGEEVGALVVVGADVVVGAVVRVGDALGAWVNVGAIVGLSVGSNAGRQVNFVASGVTSQQLEMAHLSTLSSNA